MIRINLLKPGKKDVFTIPTAAPVKESVKSERPSSTPPLILLLAVVLIAALAFMQRNALSRERGLLETANGEKRKLQTVLQKLDLLEKQRDAYKKKIELISALQFQQDTAVKIMQALSQNLPEWVWLSEVSFDGLMVKVKGKATNYTLIAEYVDGLEKSDILQLVNPTDSTQKTVKNQRFLEFNLTASVVLPAGAGLPVSPAPASAKPKGK
ncbi:MAG: hypothetical protein A2Y56_01655 [Candidatus Aminicenantes bacterium RBG_13_63_10]|nr:MAG: hypothetical protein A2Y56_01655 [Candidatus Aminicenantes bacterium RBG_13_63_10]